MRAAPTTIVERLLGLSDIEIVKQLNEMRNSDNDQSSVWLSAVGAALLAAQAEYSAANQARNTELMTHSEFKGKNLARVKRLIEGQSLQANAADASTASSQWEAPADSSAPVTAAAAAASAAASLADQPEQEGPAVSRAAEGKRPPPPPAASTLQGNDDDADARSDASSSADSYVDVFDLGADGHRSATAFGSTGDAARRPFASAGRRVRILDDSDADVQLSVARQLPGFGTQPVFSPTAMSGSQPLGVASPAGRLQQQYPQRSPYVGGQLPQHQQQPPHAVGQQQHQPQVPHQGGQQPAPLQQPAAPVQNLPFNLLFNLQVQQVLDAVTDINTAFVGKLQADRNYAFRNVEVAQQQQVAGAAQAGPAPYDITINQRGGTCTTTLNVTVNDPLIARAIAAGNPASYPAHPVTITRTELPPVPNQAGSVRWECDSKNLSLKQSYLLLAEYALSVGQKQKAVLANELRQLYAQVQVGVQQQQGLLPLGHQQLAADQARLRVLQQQHDDFQPTRMKLTDVTPAGGPRNFEVPGFSGKGLLLTENERDVIVANLQSGYDEVQFEVPGKGLVSFDRNAYIAASQNAGFRNAPVVPLQPQPLQQQQQQQQQQQVSFFNPLASPPPAQPQAVRGHVLSPSFPQQQQYQASSLPPPPGDGVLPQRTDANSPVPSPSFSTPVGVSPELQRRFGATAVRDVFEVVSDASSDSSRSGSPVPRVVDESATAATGAFASRAKGLSGAATGFDSLRSSSFQAVPRVAGVTAADGGQQQPANPAAARPASQAAVPLDTTAGCLPIIAGVVLQANHSQVGAVQMSQALMRQVAEGSVPAAQPAAPLTTLLQGSQPGGSPADASRGRAPGDADATSSSASSAPIPPVTPR